MILFYFARKAYDKLTGKGGGSEADALVEFIDAYERGYGATRLLTLFSQDALLHEVTTEFAEQNPGKTLQKQSVVEVVSWLYVVC